LSNTSNLNTLNNNGKTATFENIFQITHYKYYTLNFAVIYSNSVARLCTEACCICLYFCPYSCLLKQQEYTKT